MRYVRRGALVALVAVMFISVAPEAHAALTESQIQAILSLLNSFGADSSTTNNVNASLRGLAPAATPTTSVASDDDENSSSISAHKMECPALKSSLSRGKSGSEVARLQEFIMDYFKLDDDISTGYYGPRTEKYIKQFQAKHGIAQVGYVGAQTRAAIARACGNSTIEPVPATNSPITYDTRIAEARHNEKIVPLASCGNGNDFYDGGADLDTLTYSGKRSDFFVTKHSDGSYTFKDLIACRADTDTVINIERFIFAGTAIEIQNLNPDKIDDATLSCPQITRPACGDGAFISRGTDANGCSLGYYCGDVQPSATSTQISQTVSGITVLDSVVTNNILRYTLSAPASFAGRYVLFILNPVVSTTPIGSGAISLIQVSPQWGGGILNGTLSIQSIHEGFANNPGGVHWFPVVSGTYKLTAVIYGSNPFKPGTDMEYLPVGSQPPAQSILNSATFTIQASQTTVPVSGITVTTPNGGEQWESGILNTVTWTPYSYDPGLNPAKDVNPARDVTAYLEKSDGLGGFATIGKVQESGKASIHWMTGEINTYSTSQSQVVPGQYYIRVVNNVNGVTDRSDRPFSVLPKPVDLKVNGSDGPVQLSNNQKVSLTWTSTNRTVCQMSGVRKISGGAMGITDLPPSGTIDAFAFIDTFGTSGQLYVPPIAVECYRGFDAGASDFVLVNANATQSTASLRVVSPNGGESIDPLKQMDILYSHSGIATYSVALYKNDQWKHWILKDQPIPGPNQSWVSWKPSAALEGLGVADNAGSIFKIYVTGQKSDGTGYIEDKSDLPFSFTAPSTTAPAVAALTSSQISAVLSLLQSFGASSAISSRANTALQGGTVAIGTSPSGLTDAQGTAVLSLANSFGANASIIANLKNAMSPTNTSGTYMGYMDGALFITTQNISQADALANCQLNANNNLVRAVRCTWNGVEIYNRAAPTPTPTATTTSTASELLYAAGVYTGSGPGSSFGLHPTTATIVSIPSAPKPIILSLSAYEAVNWTVVLGAGVTVNKVILSGYHPQSVTGLPSSVPVETHSYADYSRYTQGPSTDTISLNQGAFYDDRNYPGGTIYGWASTVPASSAIPVANRRYFTGSSDYFYAYQQGDSSYVNLAAKLKTLTGLSIASFVGAYSASSLTFPASVVQMDEPNVMAGRVAGATLTCPKLSSTLAIGNRDAVEGGEVSALQLFLTQYLSVTESIVTGYFGPKTESYVKQLQAKADLEQVGYVGPMTRAYIVGACGSTL